MDRDFDVVHLRLHTTSPTGRQSMVFTMEVPVALAGVPVGSVVAWLKSLTGAPALPSNWEECDGHTCVNEASPFNGVALPNLNAASAAPACFLRGAPASGGVGGEDLHVLVAGEMPAHTHTVVRSTGVYVAGAIVIAGQGTGTVTSSSAGGGGSHENRPPFYEVVWVIRVY